MNILIIGSEGFIGSHLLHYFLSSKNYVITADIINKSKTSSYYLLDSRSPDFSIIFNENKIDICINCSGAASVPQSYTNTLFDFNLNTGNVINILETIKLMQPNCKFINLSSAAVYGNPKKIPISEQEEIKPISPYGYHKYLAEKVLEEYRTFWNIQTYSLRIFSAYGNGLKKQLIYDICNKVKNDDAIHLFGTGNETRDFIHITDICRAINLVINSYLSDDKINIANGRQITTKHIAELVLQAYDSNKTIIFNNSTREGDPLFWEADINLLKKIGYTQSISINDGIKDYVEWIKNEK